MKKESPRRMMSLRLREKDQPLPIRRKAVHRMPLRN